MNNEINMELQQDLPPTEEILFEVYGVTTDATLRELLFHLHFKQPWRIVLFVMIAIHALLLIFQFTVLKIYSESLMISAALVLSYVVYVILGYRAALKNVLRREQELNPERYPTRITVTERKLKLEQNENEQQYDLKLIKKVIATKSAICLGTYSSLFIILDRSDFVKGTCEEFCDFLRTQGFKIKK